MGLVCVELIVISVNDISCGITPQLPNSSKAFFIDILFDRPPSCETVRKVCMGMKRPWIFMRESTYAEHAKRLRTKREMERLRRESREPGSRSKGGAIDKEKREEQEILRK